MSDPSEGEIESEVKVAKTESDDRDGLVTMVRVDGPDLTVLSAVGAVLAAGSYGYLAALDPETITPLAGAMSGLGFGLGILFTAWLVKLGGQNDDQS